MRSQPLTFLCSLLCLGLLAQPVSGASAVFAQGAVATDNALASQVGAAVLERGGHAVDAAIASALVLGVVNPFASGLGGGGFALVHDAATNTSIALDFRETAPASIAREDYYPDGEHQRMASRVGGLAVATPGELAGMVALHERFGRLPWHELVQPALIIAQEGFPAHNLMVTRVAMLRERDPNFEEVLEAMYVIEGDLQVGTLVRRPKLAAALWRIARAPIQSFYHGEIADDLANAVQAAGGKMSKSDLERYQAIWREPLRTRFQGYDIESFPLPSSGGIILKMALHGFEALQIASGEDPHQSPFDSAETLHRFLHALTWGFAVRAESLGDPAFVEMEIERFLSDETTQRIVDSFAPSHRLPVEAFSLSPQLPNDAGTTHLSVIDGAGNAVAFTSTVNTIYGSRVVSPNFGILLNNEMDDFATAPLTPNAFGLVGLEANAVRPGARPLSSMSPTLVYQDGAVVGSLGGSGGPRIITGTLQTLLRLMRGANAEDAVQGERIHHQWIPEIVELDTSIAERLGSELEAKDYTLAPIRWQAAVQAIWRHPAGWDAASDPSKEGAPAGAAHGTRENRVRMENRPHP